MTYPFYSGLIAEIGYMLNYQATSHLLANAYAGEEGLRAVNESNPLQISDSWTKSGGRKRATLENLKMLKG